MKVELEGATAAAIAEANDADAIRARCDRALSFHRRQSPAAILGALAASPHAVLGPDHYGAGGAVERVEAEVARLLGKPAAMFSPKGVVAQQAALRSWCERSGRFAVALHERSHLDENERNAIERLHGIRPVRLGARHRPFTVDELDRAAEPLGAVTIELPLRNVGYRLPSWDALAAISDWCRTRAIPLHVDGARLWEAQPFYDRPLDAIAALADTVYVSFYKGLGALAGAALAGPADLVAEARVWQARHCGPLPTSFPLAIGALDGLDRRLGRMAEHAARARALARVLGQIPGVAIVPDPPDTNAFQLHLPGTPEALANAQCAVAADTAVWLFSRPADTGVPARSMVEVTIGDAADDLADDEVAALLRRVVERANLPD